MANPRRSSLQVHHQNPPTTILPLSSSVSEPFSSSSLFSTIAVFLKRPQAFPILLSVFVLLTWLSLRLQRPSSYRSSPQFTSASHSQAQTLDVDANLVRFSALDFPSLIKKDQRGWLLNPIIAAHEAGIQGGAQSCASVHMGEIRPGSVRGNHRHHTCNETFVIWGAETKFRLENDHVENKGYAEVSIGFGEVAIAASPSGTAHALINVDRMRTTFFLGCQDGAVNYSSSTNHYNVWKDLQ